MKKVILSLTLALACISGAYAQKQTGGEKNLEVQFAPLGGSPISVAGIRFRSFNSENTAIRATFFFNSTSNKTANTQPGKTTGSGGQDVSTPALYDVNKSSNFTLRVGYEKHFAGTDRLSPYVGAEVGFGRGSKTLEREYYGANTAGDQNKVEKFSTWTMSKKQGTTTIGINLLAGVDFYFADNIYLGAELGFGFSNTSYGTTKLTADDNYFLFAPTTPIGIDPQSDSDFSNFIGVNQQNKVERKDIVGDGSNGAKKTDRSIGVVVLPTLRLGWLFQ